MKIDGGGGGTQKGIGSRPERRHGASRCVGATEVRPMHGGCADAARPKGRNGRIRRARAGAGSAGRSVPRSMTRTRLKSGLRIHARPEKSTGREASRRARACRAVCRQASSRCWPPAAWLLGRPGRFRTFPRRRFSSWPAAAASCANSSPACGPRRRSAPNPTGCLWQKATLPRSGGERAFDAPAANKCRSANAASELRG